VYVADTMNNRIQQFSSTGTFLREWGTKGTGDGEFNAPSGIAVDSSNNVYVADTMNNRIQQFSSTGVFITKFGEAGIEDGKFDSPSDVAVSSDGHVYVADSGNNRIQVFELVQTGTCEKDPKILNLSNSQGTYKDEITIIGTDFCDETGRVVFANSGTEVEVADIKTWIDTKIIITVPWGPKPGGNQVRVFTASDKGSNAIFFTFIKQPKPKLTSLLPKSGRIGSEIEISGKNFGEKNDKSQVLFDNVKGEVYQWNNESIIVKIPKIKVRKKGEIVSIKIKTSYGMSNTKKFKVLRGK